MQTAVLGTTRALDTICVSFMNLVGSSSWTARSAVPHNNAKGANIDKIH